jgi:hypothetical protein
MFGGLLWRRLSIFQRGLKVQSSHQRTLCEKSEGTVTAHAKFFGLTKNSFNQNEIVNGITVSKLQAKF